MDAARQAPDAAHDASADDAAAGGDDCKRGFELVEARCSDIDECAAHTDDCTASPAAGCVNDPGTYHCVCPAGYEGEARLFTRGPTGLSLTDAGRAIEAEATAIAERVASIERRVSALDSRVCGTVRLTIPEAVDDYFVPELSSLRERYPELAIELLSDNRALDLGSGKADLAVRFVATQDPDLIVRKAGQAAWSVYAAPDYVRRRGGLRAPGDLRGHDVIGVDDSLADTVGARWLRAAASGARIALRGNSTSALVNAVAAGLGIGALPCFLASRHGGLVPLMPGSIGARDITIAMHPDLARTARVRVVYDLLLSLFARDASLWSGAHASL
jgi:DNA-binding transcriptional LysR family regulator